MLLGERQRGLGGRAVTAVISGLAALVFGSTAWQQFTPLPMGGRVFFTILFVLCGAGIIWLVYGVIRLVLYLLRGGRQI